MVNRHSRSKTGGGVVVLSLLTLTFVLVAPVPGAAQGPGTELSSKEVKSTMKQATRFMMESVADRGGFLWHYSLDLNQRWGELPTWGSQVWVQPPSTPDVGMTLLEVYGVTGDQRYLEYADRVARTLIWGQLPSGGWHYLVDTDTERLQKWHKEVGATAIGWEEFYHYYGNATFDDDTTTSAARFLLRLYDKTLDPRYRPSLERALSFLLEAQFENGAWPQRYPLSYEFPHGQHEDYTSYYTFNDDVISNNIYLLLEAYEKLGLKAYKEAALRGMRFYLISQLPSPQSGWAQQYTHDLKPGWARSYEPAALSSFQTVSNINDLKDFYRITGDRRFLEPIPRAIEWLSGSVIGTESTDGFTHGLWYEVGTNRPLYPHDEHEKLPDGRFKISDFRVDYRQPAPDEPALYWNLPSFDLEAIEKEFERLTRLSPEEASREYEASKTKNARWNADNVELRAIVDGLDNRGAWVTEIKFLDTLDWIHNSPQSFRGIDTRTYISNMKKLMAFLESAQSREEDDVTGFVDLSRFPRNELAPGVATQTPYGENLMLSLVDMEEGSVVPTHSHPHEQGGILLEGRVEMEIGSEKKILSPGDLYIVPPNVPHRVVALEAPVKILDIFSPVREEYAKVVDQHLKRHE